MTLNSAVTVPGAEERINAPRLIIEAGSGGASLSELWAYRGLLYFLAWRDMRVRYKQTAIGVAWAILQPFAMMVVFTVILGRLAQVQSMGVPYPVFTFAGLMIWNFVSAGITASAGSLVANTHLVTKIYFPRIIIPISALGAGLVDFSVVFGLLLGLIAFYHVGITPQILLAVPVLLVAILLTTATGMLICAVTIRYRDLRHALPFLMQIWMFSSPVVYPTQMVPLEWRAVYAWNPVVGIVDGFRASVLGLPFPGAAVLRSLIIGILVLVLGLRLFRKAERSIADVI